MKRDDTTAEFSIQIDCPWSTAWPALRRVQPRLPPRVYMFVFFAEMVDGCLPSCVLVPRHSEDLGRASRCMEDTLIPIMLVNVI